MILNDIFPNIYCINLDDREERWISSKKEFESENINVTRFSAIKHENPVIGCMLSHIAILEEVQKKDENVFIFEDDIMFREGSIENALEELEKIDWHMFYLGGNILRPFYQTDMHLARLSHCQSTHAYGLNKKIIPSILQLLKTNVGRHIDTLYADVVIPNSFSYIIVPMKAIQRGSYSDIEKRYMTYDVPVERYKKYFVPMRG